MDLASLIGMLGALGMIAGTMISSAGSMGPFIDVPSTLIVIGETFFAVMWTAPLRYFHTSVLWPNVSFHRLRKWTT